MRITGRRRIALAGALALPSLFSLGGVVAANGSPSCAGILSRTDAHAQLRDDQAHLVKRRSENLGHPPGDVYRHFARDEEGTTVLECITPP